MKVSDISQNAYLDQSSTNKLSIPLKCFKLLVTTIILTCYDHIKLINNLPVIAQCRFYAAIVIRRIG